ncbi:Rrf2 family transcriptional regulator [Clostridium sp. SYSU_GA19001]|uniref:RrF2 family transcriptional regulator n=1 Tax=Clostridium caldaquaticum TaxID=2940653 RepID=UPI0020778EF3|nr:Rrf2 family transcriptional regulator [Clostridium caldaquaticum]
MKISTKGIYGLKAMVDLALNSVNESITIKSISERQNISESYLEQIFSILSKKKIIKSKKGAQGGYSLGDKGNSTTVGDILRALEGDLCVISQDKQEEEKIDRILNINVWNKMNNSINKIVDSITLYQLIEEYNKFDEEYNMYYI